MIDTVRKFLPQQHALVQQVHSGIEVRLHQVGTGTGYRYVYGSWVRAIVPSYPCTLPMFNVPNAKLFQNAVA